MSVRVLGLAACLAACGQQARPRPQPRPAPAAAGSDAGMADAPVPPPIVRRGSRKIRVEAPHAGAITLLATTADGEAALTCDELGGVRLWPALDGSIEPRAVDLPLPERFAVDRDPRGFVIAMTDAVGGLVIQVVDRDGLTLQRVTLPIEPAHVGVAMSAAGIVVWRADHRILRVTAEGRIASELATEPAQRILGLATADDRALAVIETGGARPARRARWVTLEPSLAWGAWIPGATEVSPPIALSPSGRRLAIPRRTERKARTIVVDTATGAVIASDAGAVAIGLPTDDTLALVSPNGGVVWRDLTTTAPTLPGPRSFGQPPSADQALLGVGGGRAITAVHGELVLSSPGKTEYLGYALESPAVAAPAPNGRLLIGVGESFVLLDDHLRGTPAPALAIPAGAAIAALHHLAGDAWLVESSRHKDGTTAVSLVDTATRRTIAIRSGMAMVHLMLHEPSTHLVTLSLGDHPEVLRYAPGKLRLDRVATLPRPRGFERAEIVPVDPALAGGTQLVVVHMRDRLTVRWVQDPARLDHGTAVTIDGSLASVDAAGHAYVWQSDPHGMLELAVLRAGKRVTTLPSEGPTAVWPDPRGTQVIQVGARAVSLVALDGTTKWAQPLEGVTEVLWLDDGTIAIVSAAGIARLDRATGEVVAARCGWGFGLAAKPHPVSPRIEPLCIQQR